MAHRVLTIPSVNTWILTLVLKGRQSLLVWPRWRDLDACLATLVQLPFSVLLEIPDDIAWHRLAGQTLGQTLGQTP